VSDLLQTLKTRFADAIRSTFGDEHADTDPLIQRAGRPEFGDYQANLAMSLAKKVKQKPRDVAAALVEAVELDDLCTKLEVAGPGFINLHLSGDSISGFIRAAASDATLGIETAEQPDTVVVDYSSPNVAKEMHVGHLRSTVIGDAIARILEARGHDVIRQNHLGDWGTQFGMLVEFVTEQGIGEHQELAIPDLNAMYQQAKQRFDADADFQTRARKRVVLLQGGDEATLAIWRKIVEESYRHFEAAYRQLDVSLTRDDIRGESAYNDLLAEVVQQLDAANLLHESEGAKVVYPEGFRNRDDQPQAMIVQKSDGGYLYATTDLAAARFRINELKANRLIYVTDSRQRDHFGMLFQTLREAGWADDSVRLDFVPFGTVLGSDSKPFKTREGGTVKLTDLLDKAETLAGEIIAEKDPQMDPAQREQVAHAVGIGALKYADLSSDRVKDYVFDWNRMLAFEGNTAPYLQNAYVRIRSIFRKGQVEDTAIDPQRITVNDDAERALTLKLLELPSVVITVADTLEPHRLCTYLYELASAFHKFYENCPVLNVEEPSTRDSRLALCDMTARTLKRGLALLGIDTVERM